MSTPLSPLPSSFQNSRLRSPRSPAFAKDHGSMGDILESREYNQENSFSSPSKRMIHDVDVDADADVDPQTEDGEDDDQSVQEAPSSPFQFDGRDDTVDFQRLHALQSQQQQQQQQEEEERRASSLAPSERSATPRKRSFEHVPEEQGDGNVDNDEGRYKKGAVNRKDEPEINVFVDEDASFSSGRKIIGYDGAGSNSMMEERHNEGMSTVLHDDNDSNDKENGAMADDDLYDDMDDTHLSTFSAVPNADMTSFAKLRGASPTKAMRDSASNSPAPAVEASTPGGGRLSPRKNALIDLGTPIGSPMPRHREYANPGAAPKLLDLHDQPALSPRPRYSMQNARYSPMRQSPLRIARESIRSPSKASLLDFDLPPPPTPRSIPTVTPRELETLKSSFMSEISSLKATLSGREAEVSSLKQAVADAERRVGEAMEEVRNEAARKESLELEQTEWQRRGEEMESVLREVKADIVEGEQEKARLVKKVEEVEKSKEQLESRMVELESRLAAGSNATTTSTTGGSPTQANSAEETAREVQEAVEKVARELHILYKGKHETKVAALKKSYETRWEKRVREAENKVKGVEEENARLREDRETSRTAASQTIKNREEISSLIGHAKDEHEAEKRVLEAQIKGLQQEMAALREDRERLQTDLKMERAEKGELVAAVDEWLAMQHQPAVAGPGVIHSTTPQGSASPEPVDPEFHRSISRSTSHSSGGGGASGIRPPSTASTSTSGSAGEKKIPKVGGPGVKGPRGYAGGHSHSGSGGSGGKSGIAVFTPGRSGIMGSIERMGRGV